VDPRRKKSIAGRTDHVAEFNGRIAEGIATAESGWQYPLSGIGIGTAKRGETVASREGREREKQPVGRARET